MEPWKYKFVRSYFDWPGLAYLPMGIVFFFKAMEEGSLLLAVSGVILTFILWRQLRRFEKEGRWVVISIIILIVYFLLFIKIKELI